MGRYSEKYWTEGASEALAAIVTGGLSMLMDGETEFYGCEITDNETGLIGTTHRGCSSKIKAHENAWEDLMKKQEEDYKKEREVKYNRTQGGSENRLIELLIKGIVYVLIFVAIVWLIFSVAIPLLVINISLLYLQTCLDWLTCDSVSHYIIVTFFWETK